MHETSVTLGVGAQQQPQWYYTYLSNQTAPGMMGNPAKSIPVLIGATAAAGQSERGAALSAACQKPRGTVCKGLVVALGAGRWAVKHGRDKVKMGVDPYCTWCRSTTPRAHFKSRPQAGKIPEGLACLLTGHGILGNSPSSASEKHSSMALRYIRGRVQVSTCPDLHGHVPYAGCQIYFHVGAQTDEWNTHLIIGR